MNLTENQKTYLRPWYLRDRLEESQQGELIELRLSGLVKQRQEVTLSVESKREGRKTKEEGKIYIGQRTCPILADVHLGSSLAIEWFLLFLTRCGHNYTV